ncbi:SusC-like TonB-dependent outer membrane receptor precursor (fragment) [Tenacibaculum soleae]|uniref:hypothetical protein n=1 Tax=Tenacibaculum soleae TaxID=447689 RepID=UPI003AB51CB7
MSVNVSSSFTVDNVMSLPKLQSEYQSASVGGAIAENGNVADPKSWGQKLQDYLMMLKFFLIRVIQQSIQ